MGNGANGFVSYMRKIGYSHVAYSHCNYTELLATLGIIGFVLYYKMHIQILYRSIKIFYRAHSLEALLGLDLMLMILVTDYYAVSYISLFTQCMIVLIYMVVFRPEEVIEREIRQNNESREKVYRR